MLKSGGKKLFGNAMLLVCATIWGVALVAQRNASETIKPFAFDGLRFFLASAALIVSIVINEIVQRKLGKKPIGFNKHTLIGGVLCGVAIFFGNNLQQIGVATTSVGKAGFITTMYIIIVPLMIIFERKKPSFRSINSVLIALIGFVLMCLSGEDGGFHQGDLIILGSAFMISFQIIFIDMFIDKCDPFKLTFVQFMVAAIISVPAMAIEGFPTIDAINTNITSILYVGLLSAGVAFTLQTIGQKYTNPTTATLIMSLESVIGMMAGAIAFHETYTANELIGCVLVLTAVFIIQYPRFNRMLKMEPLSRFFVDGGKAVNKVTI